MWVAYYIIDGSPIIVAEFSSMFNAYIWLKNKCKLKHDGFYFHNLKVSCIRR